MTDLHDVIDRADRLFDECRFEEACNLLRQHVESNEYDILWRLARSLYSLYKELHFQQQKTAADALILEGFQIASKLLTAHPNVSASHKYYAIFFGEKAGIEGTKQQIMALGKVLAQIQTAKQLMHDGGDPFVWHLEGAFYEKLASLQWYEKLFVYALNKDLIRPTYDDALRCLLKAEDIQAQFLSLNEFLIGKVYFQQKHYQRARPYLTKLAQLQIVRTADDQFSKESAKILLEKM
ncbi:regulator of microtubule dynamics protein 1-like [Sabethes cyaneus]|uniref:regulator of microtubule dynamics protein 1-like n=1 Tax=Sabethes cyaneus TaxID=53552 RepID=UPI00237D4674|nr:regulator of microtubule dynamics protein 1-like [Sabethes cyaneus]